MIRRTVLVSLRGGDRPPVLRGSYFTEVLAEMNSERHALTRSLLGTHRQPRLARGENHGSFGKIRKEKRGSPCPAGPAPPFRANHVGSLLRPPRLHQARADFAAGRITRR